MPVVPATREAEAEELLNPGGRGCGELRSRHCTPAWVTKASLFRKKKKESKDKSNFRILMAGMILNISMSRKLRKWKDLKEKQNESHKHYISTFPRCEFPHTFQGNEILCYILILGKDMK